MVSPNQILKKCRKAGIDFWIGSKVSLELQDELKGDMEDREVNRRIYSALSEHDEEAAERFRNYHSIEVRTSNGKLQTFDKDKIVKSLLRETRVPRTVAKDIADEVSEDVRRLQIQNLSSSLIREMVNTKLLERRHINDKRNYTRIGLPIYDTQRIVKESEQSSPRELHREFSSRVLKEYTLTKVLPRNLSQEHLKSHIHIHNLEGFITSPIGLSNDLRFFFEHGFKIPSVVKSGPAKKPQVAASHAARIMLTSERYASGGVSLDSFNTFIAPYLEGLDEEEIQQVAQSFLYELNRTKARDNRFFVNLDAEVPESLEGEEVVCKGEKTGSSYSEYSEEAKKFMRIFLETYKEGDYEGNEFRGPDICVKYSEEVPFLDKLPRPVFLVNGEMDETVTYKEATLHDKDGVMQSISLNLLSYPLKNEEQFYTKLRNEVKTVKQIMKKKKQSLGRRKELLKFLERTTNGDRYIDIDNMSYNLSLVGLNQAIKRLTGEEENNKTVEREIKKLLQKLKKEVKSQDIDIYLSQKKDKEAIERFKETGIQENAFELTSKPGNLTKNIQRHMKGGAFLRTQNESLVEEGYKFLELQ